MGVKQIVYKRLNEIKPYPNNPRNNDNAVEAVANSIKKFNFQNPIIVDSEGVIVAGHTRYKAAQKLGLQTVPCIVADDLNEEQINAFRLADNKVGELATWDLDTLKVELDNIGEIDMSEFGFSLDGIGEEPQEVQEDDFDEEPPEEPTSKLGDIYQLGEHRLMCGDSTNAEHVAKLMDGAKADMVFTDPPYGMKKENDGVLNDNLNFDDLLDFNKKWIPLSFDCLKSNGSWYCWGIDEPLMDIYANILKPMIKDSAITFRNLITWDKGNGQGQLAEDFRMYPIADEKCLFVMCGHCGFDEKKDNTEIYVPIVNKLREKAKKYNLTAKKMREKIGCSSNGADHFLNYRIFRFPKKEYYDAWFDDNGYNELKAEYSAIKQKHERTKAYFDNTHDNMNNVWHFERANMEERKTTGGHATPKPIALCARAIKSSSREYETALDLFGGSGSTLIACEQLNRKCYMMEMSPKYVDVIIKRWEEYTGKKAEKIA